MNKNIVAPCCRANLASTGYTQQCKQQLSKSKVKVCFIVNSATCTVHTYRELKLHYSLTPWCIQITLNTNSRTQNTDKYKSNIYIYIQCPPLILAPLINVRKGVCENKSALFILLIFHSKTSQNSNLSLK